MTSDLKKKLLFEGDFICADGNVLYFLSLNSNFTMLKSIETNGENETTLAQISDQESVDCLQVIDNDIYFQYGDEYSSKIAKVKKDGTGFTDLEDNSTDKFTVYKEKDGKVTFKHGSALNEPFEEKGSVYAYTEKSSKRVKMLTLDEYKDLGTDLQNMANRSDASMSTYHSLWLCSVIGNDLDRSQSPNAACAPTRCKRIPERNCGARTTRRKVVA